MQSGKQASEGGSYLVVAVLIPNILYHILQKMQSKKKSIDFRIFHGLAIRNQCSDAHFCFLMFSKISAKNSVSDFTKIPSACRYCVPQTSEASPSGCGFPVPRPRSRLDF